MVNRHVQPRSAGCVCSASQLANSTEQQGSLGALDVSKLNVLVVDASVVAPAVVDGSESRLRHLQRLRGEQLAAPDLLRVEVLLVLQRQHPRR